MTEASVQKINAMTSSELDRQLTICCGSKAWVKEMVKRAPFQSKQDLMEASDQVWFALSEKDWLEAFSHHPKIGDVKSIAEKFASTKHLASSEQSGVQAASKEVIEELAEKNKLYEEEFGFIFIICATGKSAGQMLVAITDRLDNKRKDEVFIAATEQSKITKLRLEKLLL